MRGVFLLPAFIRLGHQCQESLQWNAYVHRLDLVFILSSERIRTSREKSTLPGKKISSEEDEQDIQQEWRTVAGPNAAQSDNQGEGRDQGGDQVEDGKTT